MAWDGIYRRMQDQGKEPPEALLARMDENIKFLKAGAESVRIQLHEHEKKDDTTFKELNKKQDVTNRIVLMASGGVCVAVFFINLFLKH